MKLQGLGVSPGLAVGRVFWQRKNTARVPETPGKPAGVEEELARFRQALERSRRDLLALKEKVQKEGGESEAEIFDAHLLMLDDPALVGSIEEKIKGEGLNAETAVIQVADSLKATFAAIEDEYLRQRAQDIQDLEERLLGCLSPALPQSEDLPPESIVLAVDLTPSETANLPKERVLGLATVAGGKTSHTAILARGLGIPAVVALGNDLLPAQPGETIILDGNSGTLWLNPDPSTLAWAKSEQERLLKERQELDRLRHLPATTRDGQTVRLMANIGHPEEVELALLAGAEGIGLFRTEFLFLERHDPPGEEEQLQAYRRVAEKMAPHPVIIRTLDIGGDKAIPYLALPEEANPFLGLRGLRLTLARPDLLKVQFRALLQAARFGDVRIMLPMVTDPREIQQARASLEEAKAELRREGRPFNDYVPLGIMVEVPAAALMADLLARQVDFFSLGTNDLIQYTLAIDRTNSSVGDLYNPFHPAVIRLVANVIQVGEEADLEVGMCGEMAGDPAATELLLGLGLKEFSMAPSSIPRVKRTIRQASREEARTKASFKKGPFGSTR
ncbi:MAG: phosphoenolpyruvate--protein phosphotransferase [Firmicutes bacterium]|nr:phosphoenolpyruvate--protein phosphotransferase [Bacillota bacterium]MCL5039727.1 phosphoenolpyruvate--protein phosphotransferase [Bacillota bacterium]